MFINSCKTTGDAYSLSPRKNKVIWPDKINGPINNTTNICLVEIQAAHFDISAQFLRFSYDNNTNNNTGHINIDTFNTSSMNSK